jgi:signal transduction histidine kinase
VAHDLRTPLTRVRQKLEALERALIDDPHGLKQLRRVDEDLAEVLRTFDSLLRLSEIESRTVALPRCDLDLADTARRVAEAFRPDIETSGRSLDLDLRGAPMAGDEPLLAQAVANLLENALRHTPSVARIRLATRRTPAGAELSVSDNGPGVPADRRAAVLAPFVRLEPSRTTPGSGLGLSIVAAVAARHGAQIELGDAKPGLVVTLTFPGGAAAGAVTSTKAAARLEVAGA